MLNKKKKKSALHISDEIGLHGAFGWTLSELHEQGKYEQNVFRSIEKCEKQNDIKNISLINLQSHKGNRK